MCEKNHLSGWAMGEARIFHLKLLEDSRLSFSDWVNLQLLIRVFLYISAFIIYPFIYYNVPENLKCHHLMKLLAQKEVSIFCCIRLPNQCLKTED